MKVLASTATIFDIDDSAAATQIWKGFKNMTSFHSGAYRNALIAAGLAAGLGMGVVHAASSEASMPKAHSDGVVAAVTDTAITAKVKTKLLGEANLKNSDISVATTNGVVTLTGSATNADAKSTARMLAESVEGVKSVDDELKTPGSSEGAANTKRVVSDGWITTKVKSEILADSVNKGFDVNVTTLNGVVVLKGGLANKDAIAHVKDIAAKIDGVKSVNISGLTVAAK